MGGKVLKLLTEEMFEQGMEQGIEAFIADKIEDDYPAEVIIAKLVKRFSLTEAKAEEYLKKFGSVTA